jgi:predicted lipoprotein with Yx(FWY)xxD motif
MTGKRRPIPFLAGAALLAIAPLAFAACGGGGATASTTPTKTASPTAAVGTASTGLGTILVESQGRTLYLFKLDSGSTSRCTGPCATAWPPLLASGSPTVAGAAKASLIGTTKREDGTTQVTYNGHPLYLFVNDTKPGQTNGQGLTAFGAGWFAVTPAGNQAGSHQTGSSQAKQPAAKPAPEAPAPKAAPEAPAPKAAPEAPAPKAAPEPAQPTAPKPAPPAAPKPAPPAAGGIPQNNGGDGDSDNNGGPSDGDGEV